MGLLPTELIGSIFSFLTHDLETLELCSAAHPFFSLLAERYLYYDILVNTTNRGKVSKLGTQLAQKPRFLRYPRTLEFRDSAFISIPQLVQEVVSIVSMIPRMTNLLSLTLSVKTSGRGSLFANPDFISALQTCLQQSRIQQVSLCNVHGFPLTVLDYGQSIRHLTLLDCIAKTEPRSEVPPQLLERLVLRSDYDLEVHTWIIGRMANLKFLSFHTRDMDHWGTFPGLLALCSGSLAGLHIYSISNVCTQSPCDIFLELTHAS